MAWILVASALLVLGILVIRFEPARLAVAIGGGVLVIAGMATWGFNAYQDRVELTRLAAEDVELRVATRDTGGRYAGRPVLNLQGRLYNKSERYRITQFGVRMILEDCRVHDEPGTDAPLSKEECVTVADEIVEVTVAIPPRQARDFVADLRHAMVIPKGELRWRAAGIPWIRAEEQDR